MVQEGMHGGAHGVWGRGLWVNARSVVGDTLSPAASAPQSPNWDGRWGVAIPTDIADAPAQYRFMARETPLKSATLEGNGEGEGWRVEGGGRRGENRRDALDIGPFGGPSLASCST